MNAGAPLCRSQNPSLANCLSPFARGRLCVGCPICDLIGHFSDQTRFSCPGLAVSPEYGQRK